MIYSLQVFDQTPRAVDVELSKPQYDALHELDGFEALRAAGRTALTGIGVDFKEPLYVSIAATEVESTNNPNVSIEEAEEQFRAWIAASEVTPEGGAISAAITPLIFRLQKQAYWQRIASTGQKILAL